jgi:hypothetical protein
MQAEKEPHWTEFISRKIGWRQHAEPKKKEFGPRSK